MRLIRTIKKGTPLLIFGGVLVVALGIGFADSVRAQMTVTDPGAAAQRQAIMTKMGITDVKTNAQNVKVNLWNKMLIALKKAGSKAFQVTLRTALNKIAYDAAEYAAMGDKGQRPLFVDQNWGNYLSVIGDEAAGQFIESFADSFSSAMDKNSPEVKQYQANDNCKNVYNSCQDTCNKADYSQDQTTSNSYANNNNPLAGIDSSNAQLSLCLTDCSKNYNTCTGNAEAAYEKAAQNNPSPSLNLCTPSLNARITIALGLVDAQRPSRPNCSWSEMKNRWVDEAKRFADSKSPDFLFRMQNMFEPQSSDLSAALVVNTNFYETQQQKTAKAETQLVGKGGWLDAESIGGKLLGLPGQAERSQTIAQNSYVQNLAMYSGEALVDAANIFLNHYSMTLYNKLVRGDTNGSNPGGESDTGSLTDYFTGNRSMAFSSLSSSGLQNKLVQLIAPVFTEKADFDILAQLVSCPDEKNPGPENCVIDNQFMDAVSQKKTVGEAIKAGYLKKDWLMQGDSKASSYKENYSLRNITILRKYRILPVGWEAAIQKASELGKNVTLMDLVSCFKDGDDFNTFSSPSLQNDQAWCRNLVDPDWVLKAPQNYCAKSGFGGQIISKDVVGDEASTSALSISRANDYCADEKSCIKENANGSCEAYGYCTEEKRTWNFASNSCQPIYNSCENFTTSSGGQIAYLKNTLDYGDCSDSNAGCKQYSYSGSYATSTDKVTWGSNYKIFFNNKITSCDSSSEGCTSLLRAKPAWGANLVMDSDFSAENLGASSATGKLGGWLTANNGTPNDKAVITNETAAGIGGSDDKILKIETNQAKANVYTNAATSSSLLPTGLMPENGYYYTLSAEVYAVQGDKITVSMGTNGPLSTPLGSLSGTGKVNKDFVATSTWQTVSLTVSPYDALDYLSFKFQVENTTGGNASFYIRRVKLEINNYLSGYAAYGVDNVHEKLIPVYLEAICYANPFSGSGDYRLKNNAPEICYQFARRCNRDELGCQGFTASDGFSVTGKANFDDYCPNECVGYDTYIQTKTDFNSAQSEYFIPKTASACGADAAGCSQFTNLDAAVQGGENSEYYTKLRRCIQPDQSCGTFYYWKGDNEGGYQLKALTLKKNGNAPAVVEDDSAVCNDTIYYLPPTDPNYNPDCRQFYDAQGNISYHLYSLTTTCSSDCRRLRADDKNIDKTALSAAACSAITTSNPNIDSHWDASSTACYTCPSGGKWDGQQNACVYQAIPAESTACGASENGCREYNGNNGNNVQIVSASDFENGTTTWQGFGGNSSISSDALSKGGHSLKVTPVAATGGGFYLPATWAVSGSSYTIKFLAKYSPASAQGPEADIYFSNGTSNALFQGHNTSVHSVSIDNPDWRLYQANLPVLNHTVNANERIYISFPAGAYSVNLDSIIITQITDRYYLIKNSWVTPDICYYDFNDQYRGAEYNLGCTEYTDNNGAAHDLRQFTGLCDDSSAGCEMMINTQNSISPFGEIFGDTNNNGVCDTAESGCLETKKDQVIYATFNQSHLCNAADTGCSRLGKAEKVGSTLVFSDVFLKNQPDSYANTICAEKDLGCDVFMGESTGKTFFRNPGLNTCKYRASQSLGTSEWNWYKEPIQRCDLDNNNKIVNTATTTELGLPACGSSSDCASGKCILDTNDYLCSTSYFKTIGTGGGGAVNQPDQEAGICDADASTCSEYIDPVSSFSPNYIANPSFEDIDNNNQEGDFWTIANGVGTQSIYLRAKTLYIARSTGNGVNNGITCTAPFKTLDNNNQISTTTTSAGNLQDGLSLYLMPTADTNCIVTSYANTSGQHATDIELREAMINYQLDSNVDSTSCGSKVHEGDGCVLFNRRGYDGAGGAVSTLDKDAYNSPNTNGTFASCNQSLNDTSCNSNMILKVTPDRVCGKWLACTTKIKDANTGKDSCYGLGECDKLDERGECANFVKNDQNAHQFSYGKDKNSSGYQGLGVFYLANMREVGSRLYSSSFSDLDFESGALGFNYCQKYKYVNNALTASSCGQILDQSNNYRIITGPSSGSGKKQMLVSYPAEGKNFVEINYDVELVKKGVSLNSNQNYYLNYLLNTDGLAPGARARVRVVQAGTGAGSEVVIKDFYDRTSGWERIVHRFSLPANVSAVDIYFGTEQTAGVSGKVYYDEIKIDPVLQINNTGNDRLDYVAKDCRLYPTEDALNCRSRNENVVQNGWEGYCLKKDPLNKDICLMWLPLDVISSSNINYKTAGYSGNYPLYYCAEADGNFDLVEKREAFVSWWSNPPQYSTDGVRCYFGSYNDFLLGSQYCNANYMVANPGSSGYASFYGNSSQLIGSARFGATGNPSLIVSAYCEQNKGANDQFSYFAVELWGFDANTILCIPLPLSHPSESLINHSIAKIQFETAGNTNNHIYGFAGHSLGTNGWYFFDGSLSTKAGSDGYDNGCQSEPCGYPHDEANVSNPSVRVYDYSNPPINENSLKYIDDKDNYNNDLNIDSSLIYRPKCLKFVRAVDEKGFGKTWVERMRDDAMTDTPAFFPNINTFGYNNPAFTLAGKKFSQSITTTALPYGAALLKSAQVAGQGAIYLWNKLTTTDDSIAGRPYGCSNSGNATSSASCSQLGYCENNPSLTCLVTAPSSSSNINNFYLAGPNNRTCPTGNCVSFGFINQSEINEGQNNNPPFWKNATQKNIFKNLFLNGAGFRLDSSGVYVDENTLNFDAKEELGLYKYVTQNNELISAAGSYQIKPCATTRPDYHPDFGNTLNNDKDFCAIFPTISSVSLYRGTNPAALTQDGSNTYNNISPGTYTLKFLTNINPEQQPLGDIIVDWGDGKSDLISNQDSHPSQNNPHAITHYYSSQSGTQNRQIKIKVTDNWGFWSCSPNASSCPGN